MPLLDVPVNPSSSTGVVEALSISAISSSFTSHTLLYSGVIWGTYCCQLESQICHANLPGFCSTHSFHRGFDTSSLWNRSP